MRVPLQLDRTRPVRFLAFFGLWIAAFLAVPQAQAAEAKPVRMILQHGVIHTMNPRNERGEAIVLQGERIVYVGSDEAAQAYIDGETKVIDLRGRLVLPGFTDAHVHPIDGGLAAEGCDLKNLVTEDAIVKRLAEFIQSHPDHEWIRASNFWLPAVGNGNPHKKILDDIVSDRPVVVISADGHNSWVNSEALRRAGITAATPDPAHGRIERDSATQEPTGTLRESAMELVQRVVPPYSHEKHLAALQRALREAHSFGVIGMIEASGSESLVKAYLDLEAQGQLHSYINVSLTCQLSDGMREAQRVIDYNRELQRSRTADSLVRFNQVKLFVDGVVEGKTAALSAPYVGESRDGIANAEPEVLNAMVQALDQAGLQIHFHAIGDRGIRMALDALAYARQANGRRDSRHHVAHLQVVHPEDLKRFQELDVTANFQAVWATPEDTYMSQLTLPVLGPQRSEWQYPIGSIHRAGGRIVFGSDWPVTTLNPLPAAQVAITRRGPDHTPRTAWTPQHLLDLEAVLAGYTRQGAWIMFRESESGTLEPGKMANLIVLDRDITRLSPFEVMDGHVDLTIFRGKVVW